MITETNKIDGIAVDKKNNALMLLISDHLDWDDEYNHLITLQGKINTYISFIETEQYKENYPDISFNYFIIEIRFMFPVTEKCMQFLNAVSEQIKPLGIAIFVEQREK